MTYPFVEFLNTRTSQVSSTPTLIFGSELSCDVASIIITNTTANDLLVTISVLGEVDLVAKSYFLVKNLPITSYGKQEIVNTNFQNNVGISTTETGYYTNPGDTIFANSDFVGNKFDCHVVYRQFMNSISLPERELRSFYNKVKDHSTIGINMRKKYSFLKSI